MPTACANQTSAAVSPTMTKSAAIAEQGDDPVREHVRVRLARKSWLLSQNASHHGRETEVLQRRCHRRAPLVAEEDDLDSYVGHLLEGGRNRNRSAWPDKARPPDVSTRNAPGQKMPATSGDRARAG
jgi:hypothetical protein